MSGLVLDSGALIAFERGDRMVTRLLARTKVRGESLIIPAGVVAQTWRNGRQQVKLARLLAADNITITPLTESLARASGQLCGTTKTKDIVDASVVITAREHHMTVVTSDAGDLRHLDPRIRLIEV